eukprot:1159749-Pelagomonas_calceolata.AAC.4
MQHSGGQGLSRQHHRNLGASHEKLANSEGLMCPPEYGQSYLYSHSDKTGPAYHPTNTETIVKRLQICGIGQRRASFDNRSRPHLPRTTDALVCTATADEARLFERMEQLPLPVKCGCFAVQCISVRVIAALTSITKQVAGQLSACAYADKQPAQSMFPGTSFYGRPDDIV